MLIFFFQIQAQQNLKSLFMKLLEPNPIPNLVIVLHHAICLCLFLSSAFKSIKTKLSRIYFSLSVIILSSESNWNKFCNFSSKIDCQYSKRGSPWTVGVGRISLHWWNETNLALIGVINCSLKFVFGDWNQ